jgi:tetratricopeptide (TPR) repeat protein
MINKKLFIVLVFIGNFLHANNSLDSLYIELERTMQSSSNYDNDKERRINILIAELAIDEISFENELIIRNKLIEEYEYYNLNKAIENIEINLTISKELDDLNLETETLLKFTQLLISSGQYKESIDILNRLNKNIISKDNIIQYYANYAEGYSRLSYYTIANESKKQYSKLYNTYKDTLSTYFQVDSEPYLSIKEKEFRDAGQAEKALQVNNKRLELTKKYSRAYSIIRFERSLLRLSVKSDLINDYNQKKNLILSAISDIRLSIKDNASLENLANILYQENDLETAYLYINYAYEDAEFYNSLHRKTIVSNTLPLITKAYEYRSSKQKTDLEVLLVISSLLALILFITIIYIYKQIKILSITSSKLKIANQDLNKIYQKLSSSDRVKEHYLGTFLNLYSDYINHLDMYRKMVRNHITSNKYNALLELTKSKQLKDNELKIFYKNFDEAFLKIYPNFIDEFKKLVKEDYRLEITNSKELNTELRIFALIRLGITNSAKISKILRYSVNTIYNYRATVKNNSIDRDNFEDLIKKIE